MKIFISYGSADAVIAEESALALTGAGHDVFFDRTSLTEGEEFHSKIRQEIRAADLFIFLVSSGSLKSGSYCLTELEQARDKWPHPNAHVLPVLAESIDIDKVPPYLREVTILRPKGNIAAEIAGHVGRKSAPLKIYAAGIVATLLLVVLSFYIVKINAPGFADRIPFETGWIFVGYAERGNDVYTEGPYARVAYRPTSGERGDILPEIGDVLIVRKERRVIIAGFRRSELTNQMESPGLLLAVVSDNDETGVVLPKDSLLLVRDVEISGYEGRDVSIWCRVADCEDNIDSCERAQFELRH